MSPNMNDDVLVKYMLNEANASEVIEVQAWLNAKAENQKYFNDMKKIWEDSLRLTEHSEDHESATWSKIEDRLNFNTPVILKRKSLINKSWLRLAASITMVCGLGWFAFNHFKSPAITNIETKEQVLTQILPDGSQVTLNKNSLISYASKFTGATRPVKLQGEAFFKVTPNSAKPFIISVNNITVKVIGTSFNVKNRNGKTVIVVETGIVKISRYQSSIELHPGERVTINQDQKTLSKESNPGKLYNYYRSNQLECKNTTLQELVDALNEIYHTNIVIANHTLKNKQITASFRNSSLEEILDVISLTINVQIQHKNQQIILK
ncbi:ferric-dicitrate binding protein FerR (iron transport regulator) [Pedobacter cryoconitis]|uniref:FecR family protein n=1 Tax=Pedobacter cryoconitis TaxID=188932 RepID=UPI001615B657|nr:FecR domain-containing protein [Pedobacter cryoconitis]MBB6274537.1 ferric-dicitrate binding protein FerR (iron transport regulator) [Pedobacter cryoconitis]